MSTPSHSFYYACPKLSLVVEIPLGSTTKYSGGTRTALARECPFNYGYLEGLEGEDGEELDCFLVNFSDSLTPGTKSIF